MLTRKENKSGLHSTSLPLQPSVTRRQVQVIQRTKLTNNTTVISLFMGCLSVFGFCLFCFETESLETHDGLQLCIRESPHTSEPASTSQMLGLRVCATNLFLCGTGDWTHGFLHAKQALSQCLREYPQSGWLFRETVSISSPRWLETYCVAREEVETGGSRNSWSFLVTKCTETNLVHMKYCMWEHKELKSILVGKTWWRMPLIPALRKQRRKDPCKLEASLVYKKKKGKMWLWLRQYMYQPCICNSNSV